MFIVSRAMIQLVQALYRSLQGCGCKRALLLIRYDKRNWFLSSSIKSVSGQAYANGCFAFSTLAVLV